MSDLIKEPYELSIWETSLEQNSYNNLMPPLNKAYQDEWEVFSETKTNPLDILKLKDVGESKTESSKDWSEFYFRNSSGIRSDTYTYTTKSFPATLEETLYTFFIEIKNFKYLNTLNNEVPTCEVKIVDNQNSLFSGSMINGILRLKIEENLANKKIEMKINLPRGTKRGIRNVPSELAFQIRLSLFEGELPEVPNPFSYYDGTNASWIKKENKLYTIGSNSMTAPNRAIDPVVKTNINGDKTLTFSLYSKYFDSERGDFVENPFVKILHNESYLKLRRGDESENDAKWEEYIVKNITENSANKIYTYTAKRAAAIELGKTGYNLEFSTELMNNQGTAVELTKQIFANSDWVVDEEHCDKFWGAAVEPVYEATISSIILDNIECIRQAKLNSYDLYYNEVSSNNPTRRELALNNKIYIPYSSYQNRQKNGYIQFLYPENEEVEIDESGRIYNASSYIYKNFSDDYLKDVIISNGYKGDHLQKRIKTRYIKNLNKIVQEGTINGDLIHKITDTSYQTTNSVPELIVNGKDFESTTGWREGSGDVHITLNTETDTLENIWGEDYSVKLVLSNSKTEEMGYFYNAAIRSNASIIDAFTEGEQYCIQIDSSDLRRLNGIFIAVYYYDANNALQILRNIVSFSQESTEGSITTYSGTCDFSISNKEIVNGLTIDSVEGKVGLIFEVIPVSNPLLNPSSSVAFNSISLFKKVFKADGSYYIPESEIEAKAVIEEKYYDPNLEDNINAKSLSELVFCEGSDFQPSYYEDYVKVSSIEISKSNRFNILQEICEAFECWADLQVEHNTDGSISNKKIVLKNFVGENKQVGFSYGLNLKDINRTLISDQIVTKLIVEPNNNENALNGFSTIARAKDNQSKDNVLYNFDYYINQGVLDREVLTQDIYGEKGLLYRLGKINSKITELNGELIAKQMQATQLQSEVTTAKEVISATQEEIIQLEQDFYDRTGKTVSEIEKLADYEDNSVLKEILTNISLQTKKLKQVTEQTLVPQISFLLLTEKEIPQLEGKIEEYKKDQQSYLAIFTDKYANYIQEGTWTDESYYDDDLYYLDAQNVLYTSAFPKISYTINVIDVSPLGEEFSPFKFKVGDKTYIEDTEFFGWNAAKTSPYKEEVVISETEDHLDSPEQNKITVQNYKTQFEDLFQRIAATTQSLQSAAGAYQRAANKVTSTNSIDPETLQNSFMQGIIDLQNMGNMSIKWTSEGLVISNQKDTNNKLRLSNIGIAQSEDGGEVWKTVLLAGRGITANSIVTGTLDANKISIKSGDAATFIWDAKGLRAYETTWIQNNPTPNVNFNNYIEFNDKGLIAYRNKNGIVNKPFELTAEGNLTLSGSLKVAVLEYGKVQAVGGIVLIRPSSLIKKAEYDEANNQTKIWVESPDQFKKEDWCVIGSSLNEIIDEDGNVINAKPYQITEIIGDTELVFEGDIINEITGEPTGDLTNLALVSIIDYTTITTADDVIETQENNVGIAINSSTNEAFSNARSFSIFESSIIETDENDVSINTWVRNTRLLLGELPKNIVEQYQNSLEFSEGKSTTYGLYAENAIITGHINAKSGSFTGLIEAGEGHVGGWTIKENGIYNNKPSSINPNLIIDSDKEIGNTEYLINTYKVSEALIEGEKYTIQLCVTVPEDVERLHLFLSHGYSLLMTLFPDKRGEKIVLTKTFEAKYFHGNDQYPSKLPGQEVINGEPSNISYADIEIYRFPYISDASNPEKTTIHWIKIEKGTQATDYTPFNIIPDIGDLVGLTWVDLLKGSVNNTYDSALWIGGTHSNASFRVTKDGKLTATDATVTGTINTETGQIGNLILSNNKLFGLANTTNSWISGMNTRYHGNTANTIFLWAGAKGGENVSQSATRETFGSKEWHDARAIIQNTAKFYVTHDGILHATDADISGTITANLGRIGSWVINGEYLASYKNEADTNSDVAFYISSARYNGTSSNLTNNWIYCRDTSGKVTFKVGKDGYLTATGANIQGIIKAEEGYIGGSNGWIISDKKIYSYNGPTSAVSNQNGVFLGQSSEGNFILRINDESVYSMIFSYLGTYLTGGSYGVRFGSFSNSGESFTARIFEGLGQDREEFGVKHIEELKEIRLTDNNLTVGTFYAPNPNTTSDKRLKNNILYFSSDLVMSNSLSSFFDDLKPTRFCYNHDSSNCEHFGFIAQDIAESLDKNKIPQEKLCLIKKDSKDYYTLNYVEFIPLLVYEIQKLKKEIDKLTKI